MFNPNFWQQLIFAGKVVGALATFTGAAYGIMRWVGSLLEKKLAGLNGNVTLLMTNHLPHVEKGIADMHDSFNEFKVGMATLSTTVEGMGTRLDEGKEEIRLLGTAFTQHLQFHQAASAHVPVATETPEPAARPRRKRRAAVAEEVVAH